MKHAVIQVNREQVIGETDPRLFGSFIEHLGRAVYGGIYEPEHESADDMGFREDVLELVRALRVPVVRYPGGNFVSGYHWEDGTGPREQRPRRMELAWGSIEPNLIGIDEFQAWAKRAGAEVMMAVNLGTGTPEEARNLVEYCNAETDTVYAEKRRKNGFPEPFGIRLWCLGNEMDGDWQICSKTAEEYARVACETAKLMKWTDPTIELVACGSSHPGMKTCGEWERTVLRACYKHIDYLSMHSYFGNQADHLAGFLAQPLDMDRFITETAAICDEIKAELKSDKTINLSFDEWNVWFHSNAQDTEISAWQVAPPLLEDVYNMEDALVVGCLLNTLLRHCDRVKIACLAQLVNVIAPIMTENGGAAWAQTIYYPFLHASVFGRGTVMRTDCDCETYDVGKYRDVPELDLTAVLRENESEIVIFAVNRSAEAYAPAFEGFGGYRLIAHTEMTAPDLKRCNTAEHPDAVVPAECPVGGETVLKPYSWNVLRFGK